MLSFSAFAQNFEGEIIYTNSYKSKTPQIKADQLSAMMGDKQTYLYKDGNYKSTLNGQVVQWQLYLKKDNKLYNKMATSENLLWNDASVQGDEVLDIKINKGVTEILGYKCDEIILKCKSGTQKFYFSSKLAVDPSLFVKHKLGNWYDFISKAKALPLKTIIENDQFVITSTAVKVTKKVIEASVFALPKGAKTEKSPY